MFKGTIFYMLSMQLAWLWRKPYSPLATFRLRVTFKKVDDFVAGSLSDLVDGYCTRTWWLYSLMDHLVMFQFIPD